MEKLLDLIQKVRDVVVPSEKLSKMNKKQIISFIEDGKILEKMQIFHEKRKSKALKSIVHEEEEEGIIPEPAQLKKLSVSKLRKLLREFHRDIGLKQKHAKMSASKLRSFVSRNRYQEMLYGDDDFQFLNMEDDDKKPKPKKSRAAAEPDRKWAPKRQNSLGRRRL